MPRERTRITAGLSSAFRAPNIDDLAKVFDFSIARRIYVPNPDIDPEYTYNIDLGLQQLIGDRFRIECTGFYTHYSNAIVSAPFRLNGQDSILYNSVKSAVYANQNLNKGRTYGFQAMLRAELTKHLILNSTASWTRGRLTRFNGSTIPQDHIPPFLGKTSLIYEKPRFGLELFSLYNGWKRIADYNPDGEDNQQYATADGTPAWMTLNWRAHWDLNKYLRVQVALENLLDRNYRYFASGFSAPGRNILIALRANW
jgi:hemoglobin/transferrin/lactoferrin receptor protein